MPTSSLTPASACGCTGGTDLSHPKQLALCGSHLRHYRMSPYTITSLHIQAEASLNHTWKDAYRSP